MSLLLRKLFLLSCVLCLVSCGFRPVYQDSHQAYGVETEDKLAAIRIGNIGPNDGRTEQMLRTNLEKALNLRSINVPQEYTLEITLTESLESLGVKKDREITRYNLVYTAHFNLLKNGIKTPVKRGKSRIAGGYDAVSSDFATYAAEKDIKGRIMNELANDIKTRLSSFFLTGLESKVLLEIEKEERKNNEDNLQ